ncbi:MAG: hypothetical protein L3J18_04400 [Candidatus Brocadia sp.]|jgi:hypothetical protein|nr:MAG: hypothetical protein B6D35_06610 [Candidatus Brocadia sp. UTAMX2]UJS21552.1 MAG: hypothetical protein L3J18_04400 [Candidatus Brocadia sp.]
MVDNFILTRRQALCYVRSAVQIAGLSIAILALLICTSLISPLYPAPVQNNRVQDIIDNSTITRIQKPIAIRTDRETLEYFIEHVEELAKHGGAFKKKELILEDRGNRRYGIHMPLKHVTGEFELVEWQPQTAVYLGHGNATIFFNFSGVIVLKVDYTTQNDTTGYYEEVQTSVSMKFDNAFLGLIARAASPILNRKLDKLITKLAAKTKKVVEDAYAKKKATK